MSLTWKGAEVFRKMMQASQFGIDQTMAESVISAKSELHPGHGWISGALQGSIQMRPAVIDGDSAVGFWGSFIINYAAWIEKGGGAFPGYQYLGISADREYPKLAGRIRKRFES